MLICVLFFLLVPFEGYIIWLAIAGALWIGLCISALVLLLNQLFSSLKVDSDSNDEHSRVLDIHRFTSVALLSLSRTTQLALIVFLTVRKHAPNFACVEFSFNRINGSNPNRSHYSTPLLEICEAAFFPLYLLAGEFNMS